jgi:hypothetical protein
MRMRCSQPGRSTLVIGNTVTSSPGAVDRAVAGAEHPSDADPGRV